jgi:hypothetical protein
MDYFLTNYSLLNSSIPFIPCPLNSKHQYLLGAVSQKARSNPATVLTGNETPGNKKAGKARFV